MTPWQPTQGSLYHSSHTPVSSLSHASTAAPPHLYHSPYNSFEWLRAERTHQPLDETLYHLNWQGSTQATFTIAESPHNRRITFMGQGLPQLLRDVGHEGMHELEHAVKDIHSHGQGLLRLRAA
eukprot:1157570-Pelagomonas_calceolata.AAC.22